VVIGVASLLLHAALMLAGAPLLTGVQARVRARLLGRAGPPLAQPWRDLVRLWRKRPVLPGPASWLFEGAPFACLASVLVAALLVPSFALDMATAPVSDLIVLAGLLALDRCVLALAGFETGTALGGMGASRVMLAAVWAAPAAVLVILLLTTLVGTSNLNAACAALQEVPPGLAAAWLPAAAALAIVGFAMPGRGQGGPPLASMQDAAALEYSGPALAVVVLTGQLRTLVWISLFAALVLPFGLAAAGTGPLAWGLGIAAWVVKAGVLGAAMAVLDTVASGPAVARVPAMLGVAAALVFLAAVFLFASQRLA
jgi:formate hydrogenlyase subunit 4